jgi:hypothetical protein
VCADACAREFEGKAARAENCSAATAAATPVRTATGALLQRLLRGSYHSQPRVAPSRVTKAVSSVVIEEVGTGKKLTLDASQQTLFLKELTAVATMQKPSTDVAPRVAADVKVTVSLKDNG